jgi:hypothetical protein
MKMSEWLTFREVLQTLDIKDFEIFPYLINGLHPYTKAGVVINCPNDCHEYFLLINRSPRLNPITPSELRRRISEITDDDPDAIFWKYLIVPKLSDEIDILLNYLSGVYFKKGDVDNFKKQNEIVLRKDPLEWIDGGKLMERWGIEAFKLSHMIINKEVNAFDSYIMEWFNPDKPNPNGMNLSTLGFISNLPPDSQKNSMSVLRFLLSDILEFEKNHPEIFKITDVSKNDQDSRTLQTQSSAEEHSIHGTSATNDNKVRVIDPSESISMNYWTDKKMNLIISTYRDGVCEGKATFRVLDGKMSKQQIFMKCLIEKGSLSVSEIIKSSYQEEVKLLKDGSKSYANKLLGRAKSLVADIRKKIGKKGICRDIISAFGPTSSIDEKIYLKVKSINNLDNKHFESKTIKLYKPIDDIEPFDEVATDYRDTQQIEDSYKYDPDEHINGQDDE